MEGFTTPFSGHSAPRASGAAAFPEVPPTRGTEGPAPSSPLFNEPHHGENVSLR